MARQRSFLSKSNKGKAGAVLINNIAASYQKGVRDRKKQEASSKRREETNAARAVQRSIRARERETERARIRSERERERERKEQDKLNQKEMMVEERLKLELQKMGLYPSKVVTSQCAKDAVRAGVSPAKAKSMFIEGREKMIAEFCAITFLFDKEGIYEKYHDLKQFKNLVKIVSKVRPQEEAVKRDDYKLLLKDINEQIFISKEKEKRFK